MAEGYIPMNNDSHTESSKTSINDSVVGGTCVVYRSGKLIQLVFDIVQRTATASTVIFNNIPIPKYMLRAFMSSPSGDIMTLNIRKSGNIETTGSPSSSNNGKYFTGSIVYFEE